MVVTISIRGYIIYNKLGICLQIMNNEVQCNDYIDTLSFLINKYITYYNNRLFTMLLGVISLAAHISLNPNLPLPACFRRLLPWSSPKPCASTTRKPSLTEGRLMAVGDQHRVSGGDMG